MISSLAVLALADTGRSLMEFFRGGGPVMWPLLGISILGLAVIFERGYYYARQSILYERLTEQLCGHIAKGEIAEAKARVAKSGNPLACIASAFLELTHRPRALREELLEREGGILLERVERRLPLLRLVVQVAPILGLLGTVHGLLLAFWQLESVNGPIKPSDVAGGIGSALTTTVFGLTIAIPASAFLLFFEEHVEAVARRMTFLVSHMEETLLDVQQSEGAGSDVQETVLEAPGSPTPASQA